MADVDGFELVRRKKGRRGAKSRQKIPSHERNEAPDNGNLTDMETVKCRIKDCREEVEASIFYKGMKDSLTSLFHADNDSEGTSEGDTMGLPAVDIVCYGVGNFATDLIARYQFALLLALRDDLQVSKEGCWVYDPQFTVAERLLVDQLGSTLEEQNEEGKRSVSRRTLFFMPHCGKPLYNNLLWANWGLQLHNLVIVGNSFNNMNNRSPRHDMERLQCLGTIIPYTSEVPLSNNFRYTDIFNDMAIHSYPQHKLQQVPLCVWTTVTEPVYDDTDVEIIRN